MVEERKMKGIGKIVTMAVLAGALVGYGIRDGIDYLRGTTHTNENQVMMYPSSSRFSSKRDRGEGELMTLDFKVEDLTPIEKSRNVDEGYKRVFFMGPDDWYFTVVDSEDDHFFNGFGISGYLTGGTGSGDRDGRIDVVCFNKQGGNENFYRILETSELPGDLAKKFTKAYLTAMWQTK